jgi:tyrosyl-tRNA synthetase
MDAPDDMYGKVMSWSDGMIVPGFELLTDVPMDEVRGMSSEMDDGENPVQFKHRLAKEVVTLLVGADAADKAAEQFSKIHKAHEAPEDMPTLKLKEGSSLVDALVQSKLVASKSEARRQIEQGGVKVDGSVVKDADSVVEAPAVIQKGKRHFVRLV